MCKIKLGIDTLSFKIELFEVWVLVLVLVVVLVSPETDVDLAFPRNSFRQDPPNVPVQDHFLQGRLT